MFVIPTRCGLKRSGSSHPPVMKSPVRAVLIAIAALAIPGGAQSQVVDTTATWDGSSYIAPFGQGIEADGDTPTYGQTFRAPGESLLLTSFTFWVDSSAAQAVRFTGYVMGSTATASPGRALRGTEVSGDLAAGVSRAVVHPVTFNVPRSCSTPRKPMSFLSAISFRRADTGKRRISSPTLIRRRLLVLACSHLGRPDRRGWETSSAEAQDRVPATFSTVPSLTFALAVLLLRAHCFAFDNLRQRSVSNSRLRTRIAVSRSL
jgi:hypothetical protein